MRQLYPAFGIAMLLVGWVNLAAAQTPAAVPALDYPSPLAINTARLGAGSLPGSDLDAQAWSVNLLLGFPTGVRVQRALGDDVGRDWFVEGFGGLELIFPMAGGGIRRRFTPCRGDRDSLTVSPGVDVYVLYNTLHDGLGWFSGGPVATGMFTADVEILWHHPFNDRCGAQLGVNLGAGTGFRGQGVVVPVVSVIFGLRF
jgi:hypothetical protein